jgi:hypothetical protein
MLPVTVFYIRVHVLRYVYDQESDDYYKKRINLLQELDIHAVASLHSTAFVVPLSHAYTV